MFFLKLSAIALSVDDYGYVYNSNNDKPASISSSINDTLNR